MKVKYNGSEKIRIGKKEFSPGEIYSVNDDFKVDGNVFAKVESKKVENAPAKKVSKKSKKEE